MQLQDGKVKWKNSQCPLLIENCWEWMETQLNSNGNFFQGFRHWRFVKRSKKTWRERTFIPKSLRTGSSSRQCSMTLIGQKERMMRSVSWMQRMSRITRWNSRKDIKRFWVLGRKKSGMEVLLTLKKKRMGFSSQQNGTAIQRNWSLHVQSISALSRGTLKKKKKGKVTIHFNGDSTNTKQLFQTIHYVNQRSIYGAAANRGTSQFFCGQEDVDEYTSWRSTTLGFSSEDARKHFEFRNIVQWNSAHTAFWKKAYFQCRVTAGKKYKTRSNGDDGWETILFFAQTTHFPDLVLNPKSWRCLVKNQAVRFSKWTLWS